MTSLPHPGVSILIPCYNAAATVARAVDSALAQTYRDIQVVVADDGSTDESLAVLERYAGDSRVTVLAEPHRGGNATRNRLIQLAQGEYIQFLDADDELGSRKIEACLAAFAPDVDMVFTECLVDSAGVRRQACFAPLFDDLVMYFVCHSVITMLPLSRSATLRAAGGFDERLPCCQEYELHLRLARKQWKRIVRIPEAHCTYYLLPGSVSANSARTFATKAEILLSLASSLEREGQLTDSRRSAIGSQIFSCTRQLCNAGRDAEAAAVYARARKLAPSVPYPAKWPLRLAVRVLGPVAAERLRIAMLGFIRKR